MADPDPSAALARSASTMELEPLLSAEQMRRADAFTIEDLGVPGIVLMEHAGKATADVLLRRYPHARRVVVLCGPGNNGGDGWICARHLWGRGVVAPVVTLVPPDQLGGDAQLAAQMFLVTAEALELREDRALDGSFALIDLADDPTRLLSSLQPDVIVDALFGTGLGRPLDALAARIVQAINDSGVPVLSIDVPTGLPSDGQAPAGPVVQAAVTVTFSRRRVAHASVGRHRCGSVELCDIGVREPKGVAYAAYAVASPPRVPVVDVNAHKGKHGHTAVVCGSPSTAGAAALSGIAALRAGCGLVSLVVDGQDRGAHAADPELMLRTSGDELLEKATAYVVGPGLGADAAAVARAQAAFAHCHRRGVPLVVDAEALPLAVEAARANALAPAVLTPHPGEAARMLSTTSEAVQADRLGAAKRLAALVPGAVVVLKGVCPVIIDDAGRVLLVEGDGASALAVAGSGDVLAGAIGALLARGMSVTDAAVAAVVAHQRAGRTLSDAQPRGWLARDVAHATGRALL